MKKYSYGLILLIIFVSSCQSIKQILNDQNPRKNYIAQFEKSELNDKALFRKWMVNWNQARLKPLSVKLPYREQGIIFIADPSAYSYQLSLKEGQLLQVVLESKLAVFCELYDMGGSNSPLAHLQSDENQFSFKVKKTGEYLLLFQGDLLEGGKYELNINTSASLNFPVSGSNSSDVGSFWGAARDGGKRSHKGVDIFADRGTPVVAVEGGMARAKSNNLGGKVVWLYNASSGTSYYYAHLDSQAVSAKLVKTGDTLGFVGNTGNAKYTPPHLHFGIYGSSGAVDPFPFIDNKSTAFPEITTDTAMLGNYVVVQSASANVRSVASTKNNSPVSSLPKSSGIKVLSATGEWLKVAYNNVENGFIHGSLLKTSVAEPILLKGTYIITDDLAVLSSDTLTVTDTIKMIKISENEYLRNDRKRYRYTKL